jgi:hypothetical protein
VIANLLWLLPCAAVAMLYPDLAVWLLIAALLPIVLLALAAGAGQPVTRGPHDTKHL